jgi:hypothetical protein
MAKYSCLTILKRIIFEPLSTNIIWLYILKPILYTLIFLAFLASMYLYLVPFTNIVGIGLFADYTCPNTTGVWQTCGRTDFITGNFSPNGNTIAVGFFVFIIIQSTIGLFLLSILCYSRSLRKGYIKRFNWSDCVSSYFCCKRPEDLDEWTITNTELESQSADINRGPYLYFNFTISLFFSILVSTIFVGIYVGRYIAVNRVGQCIPYRDSRIGLYGCVSNSDGKYVGGQNCMNCAGIGFGILGIPLLVLEIMAVLFYYCMKRCYISYKETEEILNRNLGVEQLP